MALPGGPHRCCGLSSDQRQTSADQRLVNSSITCLVSDSRVPRYPPMAYRSRVRLATARPRPPI